MTYQSDTKLRILYELRNGPLDQFAIAASTALPPYHVRAELRALRRDRLVADYIDRRGHQWTLTARGIAETYAHDQMELLA